MATTFLQLRNSVRDFLNDWEYEDWLTSGVDASTVTFPVSDGAAFAQGDVIQIENELALVRSIAANNLTVRRGYRGTAAVSHAISSRILRSCIWTDAQLGVWVNESLGAIYPWFYIRSTQDIVGTSSHDYVLGDDITDVRQIERVEYTLTAVTPESRFTVMPANMKLRDNGSGVSLYIPADLTGFTLTVFYTKPFTAMASDDAITDLPARALNLPVYYAAARALEQREALRSRYAGYETTQNERAVQPGTQILTGDHYWKLFKKLCKEFRMPKPGRVL